MFYDISRGLAGYPFVLSNSLALHYCCLASFFLSFCHYHHRDPLMGPSVLAYSQPDVLRERSKNHNEATYSSGLCAIVPHPPIRASFLSHLHTSHSPSPQTDCFSVITSEKLVWLGRFLFDRTYKLLHFFSLQARIEKRVQSFQAAESFREVAYISNSS